MSEAKNWTYRELIIATGSKSRVAAARNQYDRYAFFIDAINPEKAYGVEESMSNDTGMVAFEKTEAILQNQDLEHPTLIVGSDVATWTWKAGQTETDSKEMKKAIRQETDDQQLIREKMAEVQVIARQLYCNGTFYVKWDVGIVWQSSDKQFQRGAVLECFADFPMGLDAQTVDAQTSLERSVFDNSIVNLASLVSKFGTNIRVRNRGEKSDGESVSAKVAELLIVGGVLPHVFFQQFLSHETSQDHKTASGALAYQQVNLNFARV